MADYIDLKLTDAGRDIYAQAGAGAQIVFTRAAIGDGRPVNDNYRPLTQLVNERLSLTLIDENFVGNGTVKITAAYSNAALNQLIEQREAGIFAIDPRDGVEKLYQYTWAPNRPDYLESGDGDTPQEGKLVFTTVIGNDTDVVVRIDRSLVFATLDELDEVRLSMALDIARTNVAIAQLSEAHYAEHGKYPQSYPFNGA